MTRSWRCILGLHQWQQNQPFDGTEGFPGPGEYRQWVRVCVRCQKRQIWLPGFGGSEWGCWLTLGRGARGAELMSGAGRIVPDTPRNGGPKTGSAVDSAKSPTSTTPAPPVRGPRLCQACSEGDHANCGLQTWCECDCPGPDGDYIDDEEESGARGGPPA